MGTQGGERGASQSPPDTTIFLEADDDIYSTSGLHVWPSNGRKPRRGMVKVVETAPDI